MGRYNTEKSPTPEEVYEARTQAGLTQVEACALIHCVRLTWIKWEKGESAMHPAFWELFLEKTKKLRKKASQKEK